MRLYSYSPLKAKCVIVSKYVMHKIIFFIDHATLLIATLRAVGVMVFEAVTYPPFPLKENIRILSSLISEVDGE